MDTGSEAPVQATGPALPPRSSYLIRPWLESHGGTISYIHPNGESYVGQFHEGHMQGRGLYKYARGTSEGDWLADKKHGHGVYRFADGDWYDGQFVNPVARRGHL